MEVEVNTVAQALAFWTNRLGMSVEELLQFLDDHQINIDDLWLTLTR